jgi:hypothetical protein
MNVTATNAILFGAGKDVRLSSGPGMTAHLDVDHSNYDPAFAQLQGAGSSISGSANQTAAPSLVDAPPHGIDFRQFQDSPTIDAGVTDPLNGTKDFTGDLRTLGSSTDIGADEWNPATAQTGGAIAITQTSASVGGVVTPNGNATSSYVEYGTTTAYGSQTSPKPLGSGNAPVSTGADLTGLSPGTTYHYRLVATNALGTIPGGDSTFTTVAAPGESSGGSTTATTAGTTTPSTPSILPPTSVLPITPPTKTTTKKPSCAKSRLATSAKKKKKRKPTCKKPKRKKTKKKK